MRKLSIDDVNLKKKKVLVRVDYNVPMLDGEITDDSRIVTTLPSLRKILKSGGSLILMSHLGRPQGKVDKQLTLRPVAEKLSELLEEKVKFLPDCIGARVKKSIAAIKPGEIILLENLRFHPGETKNNLGFAKKLAEHGDIYVNDAFAVSHRAHASVVGIPKILQPACSGYLIAKEITYMSMLLDDAPSPFVAVIGGAKVSTKIDVLKNLLPRVDKLLIGGGMAFTFLATLGLEIGESLVEKNALEVAMNIWLKSEEMGGKMMLPLDVLVASEISDEAQMKTVEYDHIPKEWVGVDIGQSTIQLFTGIIEESKSVFLNGPMGIFEYERFSVGTETVLESMSDVADRGDIAVVGGGDSAAAAKILGFQNSMTHISTGGGASLEFMEGKSLPGIDALTDK